MNIREIFALVLFSACFGYVIITKINDAPFECRNFVCTVLLVIYTFIFGNLSLKQYTVFALSEVLITFSDEGYSVAILCILAAYDLGVERIKKLLFAVLSAIYGMSFILSVSGFISTGDMSVEETRLTSDGWLSVRHSFGFCHPNTAGLLLAVWVILLFAVRFSKLKWCDWLAGIAASGIITFIIDSRGAMVLILVFLLLMFIAKYGSKIYDFKPMKFAFPAVPIAVVFLSVFAAYFYNPDNALWSKINSLSTGRIFLMSSAADQIPVTLLGKITNHSISSEYFVDNFYINFLLYQGIIPLLIIVLSYVFLLYRLYKLKAYPEIAMVVSYMFYFLFEQGFFMPFINFSFVLFPFIFSAGSRLFIYPEDSAREKGYKLRQNSLKVE